VIRRLRNVSAAFSGRRDVGEQDNTAGEWVLTPETLDLFVRALVSHVDYDIHKGYECGEEDGEDHYPELVAEAAEMLDAITSAKPEEQGE
jgi:hypothetical protein